MNEQNPRTIFQGFDSMVTIVAFIFFILFFGGLWIYFEMIG